MSGKIPSDQEIGGVTADGACHTRECHDTIADGGTAAVNAQVIPPRKTSRPWRPTSAGAVAGNEAVRTSKYPGRAALVAMGADTTASAILTNTDLY